MLTGIELRLLLVLEAFRDFLARRLLVPQAFLFTSPHNFLIPLRLRLAAIVGP
jgi:hypothetical protein